MAYWATSLHRHALPHRTTRNSRLAYRLGFLNPHDSLHCPGVRLFLRHALNPRTTYRHRLALRRRATLCFLARSACLDHSLLAARLSPLDFLTSSAYSIGLISVSGFTSFEMSPNFAWNDAFLATITPRTCVAKDNFVAQVGQHDLTGHVRHEFLTDFFQCVMLAPDLVALANKLATEPLCPLGQLLDGQGFELDV